MKSTILSKAIFYFLMFTCLPALSYAVKAQLPDYKNLSEYVNKESGSSESLQIIIQHLEKSATTEPIEELVRWTNDGFPELHDKNNIWNTDPSSIYLCVAHSVNYFFSVSELPDKGQYYLKTVEKFKSRSDIVYYLTQTAFKILNEKELEAEFFRLINLADADERIRGLLLGLTLASQNRDIFDVYIKILKQDKDVQVRSVSLHMLAMLRQNHSKEVARLALERLFIEENINIRKISSVIVRQGADALSGWTQEDSGFLLSQMLNAKDNFVRKAIGVTVAKLTAEDKSLIIIEETIPENLFEQFVSRATARKNELQRNLEPDELLTIWKEWWTPLIPKYAIEPPPIGNCD